MTAAMKHVHESTLRKIRRHNLDYQTQQKFGQTDGQREVAGQRQRDLEISKAIGQNI